MIKLIVTCHDEYIMTVTNEEYQDLQDGNIDITELIEEKETTEDMVWKNGYTSYE